MDLSQRTSKGNSKKMRLKSAKAKAKARAKSAAPQKKPFQAKNTKSTDEDAESSDCEKDTHHESHASGSIPTFDGPEKPPVGYIYSDKTLFHHDTKNNSVTIFEKTGIEVDLEKLREAEYNVEVLEQLPMQPRWFPQHIKDIFDSGRCPESLSFTVSYHENRFGYRIVHR